MESEEEKFHEFFEKRPVIFVLYTLYIILISFLGIFGNSKIICTKLKKFRHLSGIEIIIVNFSLSLILYNVTLWIIVSEEIWPSLTQYMCNFNPMARTFTMIFMALLLILLIICSKCSSRIKVQHGIILLLIIWIIAILYAYPYFELRASPLSKRDDKFQRYICVYNNPNMNSNAIDIHHKITTIFNFITCPVLILICVVVTALWRNLSFSYDKDIWTYSIVVGLYYLIADSPLMINALSSYLYNSELSRTLEEFFNCLVNFTVVLNPLLYGFYVDKNFFQECIKTLKLPCIPRKLRRIRYVNPNNNNNNDEM